jgi:RNA polymerase sigma-70 factor (sigma-E family)
MDRLDPQSPWGGVEPEAGEQQPFAGLVASSGRGGRMDDGVPAEFSEFAHSRWNGLVRLALGLTGDLNLAEDIVQTALVNTFTAWGRVRRADDPDAYVRRILLNVIARRFRRRRLTEQLTDVVPEQSAPGSASRTADPALSQGDRAAIIAALRALPLRQREIVVLRYWLDLTEHQVAAALGCSVGNVKSQTSRALTKLRNSAELSDWRPVEHE